MPCIQSPSARATREEKRYYVLVQREFREINVILGSRDKIDQLPHLGLVRRLLEKLEKIDIVRLVPEMHFDQAINGGLEHERIVDSDHSHFRDAVPTRLRSPRDGSVHDIVRDEKEGLKLAYHTDVNGYGPEG